MDFLNKIGDLASKTYKKTSQKTGEIAKEAKIKIKMNENKVKIKGIYEEIGKIVYQKHINNEEVKIKEDLKEYCSQIETLAKEIEGYQAEILKIKNKRICENCYTEIELDVRYCPNCGFEQENIIIENDNKSTEDANNEEKED